MIKKKEEHFINSRLIVRKEKLKGGKWRRRRSSNRASDLLNNGVLFFFFFLFFSFPPSSPPLRTTTTPTLSTRAFSTSRRSGRGGCRTTSACRGVIIPVSPTGLSKGLVDKFKKWHFKLRIFFTVFFINVGGLGRRILRRRRSRQVWAANGVHSDNAVVGSDRIPG